MKDHDIFRPFLVGCALLVSVTLQEQIFVGTRLDGSAIGPYKIKSLDRFYDRNDSRESLSNDKSDFYSPSSFNDEPYPEDPIKESKVQRPNENVKIDSSLEVNELYSVSRIDSKIAAEDKDQTVNSKIESSLSHLPNPKETNLTLPPNDSTSNLVSSLGTADGSMSDESIDFELFPYLIDQDTEHRNSAIITTQNSTDDLNNTLEEVKIITETTDPANDGTLTPPTPALCHAACSSQLEKITFKYSPKSPSIQRGGSLALECSVPFETESSVKMIWLFQKINPPSSQCSLTPQESIHLCNNFAAVEHTIDSNFTSKIAAEKIILSSLTSKDSGYYFCLIELTCCPPEPHIMQQIRKTETPIEVFEENYVLELSVLGGLVGCLLVLLTIGTYLQKKRRRRNFFPPSKIESNPGGGVKDVLHAPILGSQEDSDSFEESDGES